MQEWSPKGLYIIYLLLFSTSELVIQKYPTGHLYFLSIQRTHKRFDESPECVHAYREDISDRWDSMVYRAKELHRYLHCMIIYSGQHNQCNVCIVHSLRVGTGWLVYY